MGKLGHRVLAIVEEAAPRGKVMRLQLRMTADQLVTLAFMAFAIASGVGYQLLRWRAGRTDRP